MLLHGASDGDHSDFSLSWWTVQQQWLVLLWFSFVCLALSWKGRVDGLASLFCLCVAVLYHDGGGSWTARHVVCALLHHRIWLLPGSLWHCLPFLYSSLCRKTYGKLVFLNSSKGHYQEFMKLPRYYIFTLGGRTILKFILYHKRW